MTENDQNSGHLTGPRLYDIDKVGAALDAALESRLLPLDALIRGLHDKLVSCLEAGYTIRDLVAMIQGAGVDATDRQVRYAITKAGINGASAIAARASRRGTSTGRSGGRKTVRPKTQAEQAGTDAGQNDSVAGTACSPAPDALHDQTEDKDGQEEGGAVSASPSTLDAQSGQTGNKDGQDKDNPLFDSSTPGAPKERDGAHAGNGTETKPAWTPPQPGAARGTKPDLHKYNNYAALKQIRGES